MSGRTGVLVMSYGTPGTRDEVADYYTRIRHGHPPSAEQLADLERRYDAIGGLSPLRERTDEQVAGLERALVAREPDRYVVRGGTKYATPSIEDAVAELQALGVTDVVGIVLAPLSAQASTGQYHDRARAAVGDGAYRPVWAWWDAEGFADLLAQRVRDAVATSRDATVLFTAHSLPERAVGDDDYQGQLAALASAVSERAGIADHLVCWQSAGKTQDAWLGPDVLEVLRALDPATRTVVVCPAGFVSDHLEVLFDLDVDGADVARSRGIELRRTASLNDDPAFLDVLATLVAQAAST